MTQVDLSQKFTLTEVGAKLGLSYATVRRLVNTRQLGCIKLGYRTYVLPSQLDEYIQRSWSQPELPFTA